MATMLRRLLVLFLLSSPALAAPFVLSDPRIDSMRSAPREISVGGSSSGGFMIAGLSSWTPSVLGINDQGDPRTLGGDRTLDTGTASGTGEPVFVGGRWIVPIAPDFMAPDRIFLAQVKSDGTPAGETKTVPWPGVKGAAAAFDGSTLLIASTREHDFYTRDVYVRSISSDLAIAGDEHLVASGVISTCLRTVGAKFVLAYRTPFGLGAVVLAGDGGVAAPPVVLSTNLNISNIDVVDFGGKPAVAWTEEATAGWSYRISTLDDPSNVREIVHVDSERVRAFARTTEQGVVVAWNSVWYDGQMRGYEIHWAILGSNGTWVHPPQAIEGTWVLRGAASNGSEVLLVWDKHVDGIGTPMWGAVVSKDRTPVAKFLAIDYAEARELAVTTAADGTTFAAWSEADGLGDSLFAASFDRDGRRLGIHEVRSITGTFQGLALATNGNDTLLFWQQGWGAAAAYLGHDGSVADEPFAVAAYDPSQPPHEMMRGTTLTVTSTGFFASWIVDGSRAEGAEITGTGVGPKVTIAVAPPPNQLSTFSIESVRVAAGERGSVAVMNMVEYYNCVQPMCGSRWYAGVARFGVTSDVPVAATLDPDGHDPDVATDGSVFIVLWGSPAGIRERVISHGVPDRDSLLFARASSPLIAWNGSGYSAVWRYGVEGHDRSKLAVARISREGEITGPLRGIEVSFMYDLAAAPGEALVAWIDLVNAPSGTRRAPVAEFESNMEVLPDPPVRRRAVGR